MSYESWRISFQSSEAAARSAYNELDALRQQLSSSEPVGEVINSSVDGFPSYGELFVTDLPNGTELYTHPQSASVDELVKYAIEYMEWTDGLSKCDEAGNALDNFQEALAKYKKGEAK